jgi:hypothetical protein
MCWVGSVVPRTGRAGHAFVLGVGICPSMGLRLRLQASGLRLTFSFVVTQLADAKGFGDSPWSTGAALLFVRPYSSPCVLALEVINTWHIGPVQCWARLVHICVAVSVTCWSLRDILVPQRLVAPYGLVHDRRGRGVARCRRPLRTDVTAIRRQGSMPAAAAPPIQCRITPHFGSSM